MSRGSDSWTLFGTTGTTGTTGPVGVDRVEAASVVAQFFDPTRLTQARVLAGLTKRDVAEAVGVSPSAVGQYEAKVVVPRPEVLLELSKALDQDVAFFAGGRPYLRVDTGNAHFRSLRSMRASDRDRALATAEQVWELTCALEQHVQLPDPALPTFAAGTSPSAAAKDTRGHWQLPAGPVRHLVSTLESHGVVVLLAQESGHIDRVDAFSTVVSDRPIIISTPRRSNDVYRHRFTCAHELGHLLLHPGRTSGDLALEREANEFAAEFLTPTGEMRSLLPHRMDLAQLDTISRTWGVSISSLIRRMSELRVVSNATVRRAHIRLTTVKSLTPDHPIHGYPGETPRMLVDAVQLANTIGVGLGDLANDLRWKTTRIRELLGIDDPRPTLTILHDESPPERPKPSLPQRNSLHR